MLMRARHIIHAIKQTGYMTTKNTRRLLLISLLLFSFVQVAYASTTDGTVDGTNRWAWSESAGWIDFGTSAGDVQVTDSALTGYAYGEGVGWISLNCSNTSTCGTNSYAVANDGSGNLSGYAWGSSTGWINFAPSGGGVHISSSGVFSGTAYAENIGWIVFATDHPVTTDWRPASSRTSSTPAAAVAGNGPPVGSYGSVSGNTAPLPLVPPAPVVAPLPTTTVATTSPAAQVPTFLFTKDRHLGESGTDVQTLQEFLNSHGAPVAATGVGSPGHETTYFGARTRAALAVFQKAHGIVPASGYFGPLTRGYINSHY